MTAAESAPYAQALRCRCVWRGERCENRATQEDGLCNWCGNGRTVEQQRDDPNALVETDGRLIRNQHPLLPPLPPLPVRRVHELDGRPVHSR